jgi:hypothetical protein
VRTTRPADVRTQRDDATAVRQAGRGAGQAPAAPRAESERDVDSRDGAFVSRERGGGIEEIREPLAGDKGRDGDELARGAVALERSRRDDALVGGCGEVMKRVAELALVDRELRPEVQPFEHRAVLAVEREGPAAETVFEAGGRS